MKVKMNRDSWWQNRTTPVREFKFCLGLATFSCDSISDTVVFDNSYSIFKSKKITYSVVLTSPLSEVEKSASQIEEKLFDQNDNEVKVEWPAVKLFTFN